MVDLVIRGGTIVDGTGAQPFTGDIAIEAGLIVEVSDQRMTTSAKRVVNADGLLVTPGFVDVHTHFDGQVTWDDTLEPSMSHGVTTAVIGNCGVGFAPVRPGCEDDLIKLMEGVEDIPGVVLSEGIKWEWESFPEYLDALSRRTYSMDIGAQIPHGALRAYVMGERGFREQSASDEDIAQMSRLVEEAVRSGALGVSTSRSEAHQSSTGEAVPGTFADQRELLGLASGLQRAGGGVLQAIPTLVDGYLDPGLSIERTTTQQEVEMLGEISKATGCTITYLLLQNSRWPDGWKGCLEASDNANLAGAKLVPQVAGRPIGTLISLDTYHLLQRRPTYMKLAELPLDKRASAMRDPGVRAAILSEDDVPPSSTSMIDNLHLLLRGFLDNAYSLAGQLDYDPGPNGSIAAIAARRGVAPLEIFYEELIKDHGKAFIVFYALGYQDRNFSPLHTMLTHPGTVLGLGDGGAHTRFACDASVQTFMLSHWAKNDAATLQLPIEFVVKKQTFEPASLYGLKDRGRLAAGMRADVNIIDFEQLSLFKPEVRYDLPAGGARIIQASKGYVGTFVSGIQTRANDSDLGKRPGRVIRR